MDQSPDFAVRLGRLPFRVLFASPAIMIEIGDRPFLIVEKVADHAVGGS